jgi:predicted phage terminase large subunit-like protein
MSKLVDDAIRSNFLALVIKAFAQLHPNEELVVYPYVELLARQLEAVASGKTRRLVISLPPRHLKTVLVSICLPVWILAHRLSAKILILSYGQELADEIAYSIREILRSEWYCRLFRTRIAKSRLTDIVTTANGCIRSVSIEGSVTGFGADIVIADDTVQIKDCDNEKQLQRINTLFDGEIRTRLNNPKKGAIVIVAHRLAEDDLPGHVLREAGWKEVRLPLIAPRRQTYEIGGFVWQRQKGDLLRPDAFTARDVERLRSVKRPGFETLQQQRPGARDRLNIRAEHFGAFVPAMIPPDGPVVLSIDPGQKGGPTHSFSAVQAWAPHAHAGGHLLLDSWREQALYRELRHAVRRFIIRYRPSVILVEDTGQGPSLLSDIRPQQGMRIVTITPDEDKESRLRRHRKAIRNGIVALPEGAPWVPVFIDEIVQFPYGYFDDQVDGMTQFLDWIAEHPHVAKRPPRATPAAVNSRGIPIVLPPGLAPTLQCRGAVFLRRPRRW